MTTGGEGLAPSRTGAATPDPARALAELDAIRRRVINVVGHVLRTPATTIAGMAAALQTADDEATRAMLVDGLARNARRLEQLLDDLLVATGVSTALPIGEAVPTPIVPALSEAWDAVGGPGVLAVHGPQLAARVRPQALERIATILLDNALKYGHGPVSARISQTASGLRLEIESVGTDASDEEIAHACEPLYRGEHAVMTAPGLGLGLAVARELARADGGDLALERRSDMTVACLDLPV